LRRVEADPVIMDRQLRDVAGFVRCTIT
jgi:hypothetical protein